MCVGRHVWAVGVGSRALGGLPVGEVEGEGEGLLEVNVEGGAVRLDHAAAVALGEGDFLLDRAAGDLLQIDEHRVELARPAEAAALDQRDAQRLLRHVVVQPAPLGVHPTLVHRRLAALDLWRWGGDRPSQNCAAE